MQFEAQQGSATAPNWLDDRFLQEVIRKAKNDPSITLYHSCKVRPGGRDGVQHASNLLRTTVHYRSKRVPPGEQAVDLILKIDRGMRSEMQFSTEIRMYTEVLPAMEQVLRVVGETMHVPKYFYSSNKPQQLIVMEDLFPSGWNQKSELISFDDAKSCVDAVAKFHAASFIISEKLKHTSSFQQNLRQMTFAIDSLIESLSSQPGYNHIATKLHSMKPHFQRKLKQIYSGDRFVCVLNHGDLNVTNLWYRIHPESKVALIDFQNCHWGTPAIDLLRLLDVVLDRTLRKVHSDRLAREYYQAFIGYLRRFGHRGAPFGLQDLVNELRSCAVLELFHLAMKHQQNTGTHKSDENKLEETYIEEDLQQDLNELLRRGILE